MCAANHPISQPVLTLRASRDGTPASICAPPAATALRGRERPSTLHGRRQRCISSSASIDALILLLHPPLRHCLSQVAGRRRSAPPLACRRLPCQSSRLPQIRRRPPCVYQRTLSRPRCSSVAHPRPHPRQRQYHGLAAFQNQARRKKKGGPRWSRRWARWGLPAGGLAVLHTVSARYKNLVPRSRPKQTAAAKRIAGYPGGQVGVEGCEAMIVTSAARSWRHGRRPEIPVWASYPTVPALL